MGIFLACVSGLALLVSAGALCQGRKAIRESGRSADAAETSAAAAARSALAAESLDRQGREPILVIELIDPAPLPGDIALYRIRNDGPQDLSSVTMFRPKPPDGITYPLAITGKGYAHDEVSFALRIGEYIGVTFCCGAAEHLPEFRVRIDCVSGPDHWSFTRVLPFPRGEPRAPLGVDPGRARAAVEIARQYFQESVTRGGRDKSYWLSSERKGTGQELRDNADRVGDARFRAALEAVAEAWDHAFALAPTPRGIRVVNLDAPGPSPADVKRRQQLADVEGASQQGLDRCFDALAIMNELEGRG
jgi:hypothetical protein